jgi:hypothetical protein
VQKGPDSHARSRFFAHLRGGAVISDLLECSNFISLVAQWNFHTNERHYLCSCRRQQAEANQIYSATNPHAKSSPSSPVDEKSKVSQLFLLFLLKKLYVRQNVEYIYPDH